MSVSETAIDHEWEDVQRLEGWAGEMRLNVIRLVAIVVFYGRHLVEYFSSPADAPLRGAYHMRVTLLCLIWAAAALLVHLWLVRRRVPPSLKYSTTIGDTVMITLLCMLAGGPKTPLALLYFPLIATAPLRLSLRLVYVATAAAILGYLCVLAAYAWFIIGFDKYYSTPELRIPRSTEAVYVLALLVSGFLAGQFVRQVRRVVSRYPVRIADEGAPAGTSEP